MSDLDTQIEAAIKSGAKLKDIAAHLDQSEDPEHKAWANNYFKRSPVEAATPTNDGSSAGFGNKTSEFATQQKANREADKKSKEVTVDVAGQSFAIPEWLQVPGGAALGGAAVTGLGMAARKLFGGSTPTDGNVPADVSTNPATSEAPTISKSAAQQQIDEIRLQREQLKLKQDQIKHDNWVAKNTLSEAEQAFGRKAKDPTELRLMQTAFQQQSGKGPVAPTQSAPAPVAPVVNTPEPSDWLKMSNQQVQAPAPVNPPAPPVAPAPVAQPVQPVEPANVVSTGPTPEAAAAPIEKAEEVKAVTTPKKVKEPINPEDAKLSKQELGMKKHLLGMYGDKENPLAAAKAYETVKEILGYTPAYPVGEGGSLNPEEKGKVLGYRKENIAGPKVNLTHDMKKILKKGGPAVAVLAASTEFANAKTPEQKASAGTNLLGAILPPGADILEAGAPTISQKSILDAYKLGSPFAQTEEAKKARLREKAGAGRGIAPPSAYMR